jgi:hypothetical protein
MKVEVTCGFYGTSGLFRKGDTFHAEPNPKVETHEVNGKKAKVFCFVRDGSDQPTQKGIVWKVPEKFCKVFK